MALKMLKVSIILLLLSFVILVINNIAVMIPIASALDLGRKCNLKSPIFSNHDWQKQKVVANRIFLSSFSCLRAYPNSGLFSQETQEQLADAIRNGKQPENVQEYFVLDALHEPRFHDADYRRASAHVATWASTIFEDKVPEDLELMFMSNRLLRGRFVKYSPSFALVQITSIPPTDPIDTKSPKLLIFGHQCLSSIPRSNPSPRRFAAIVNEVGLNNHQYNSLVIESTKELEKICRLFFEPSWYPRKTLLPSYLSTNWTLKSIWQPNPTESSNYRPVRTLFQEVVLANDIAIINAARFWYSVSKGSTT
jgi:hypothetical protein